MSIGTPDTENPSDFISFTVSNTWFFERATITTCAPCSARATAQPRPIPRDPPVTIAHFPSKREEGVLGNIF